MKYSIIYADPPWRYNNRANHKTRFRGGACGHYPLMTMPEIAALPIGKLAARDCALLMWCTFPYLADQIKLFDHWGFPYRRTS
jgi:N6-adenosine-specific RNA methylase IME4